MPPKKSMTWDAEADRKLFMSILKTSNVKFDYKAVAEEMSTDVVSVSNIAIQRRLEKLRAMCGVKGNGNVSGKGVKRNAEDEDDGPGVDKNTPPKKKVASKSKKAADPGAEVKDEVEDGPEF